MAAHIPFVNSKRDWRLVCAYYEDSVACRFPLEGWRELSDKPRKMKTWVDAGVDGLHRLLGRENGNGTEGKSVRAEWKEYISSFECFKDLAQPEFVRSPKQQKVDAFVASVLERADQTDADWISVPQLPITDGVGRNKINRSLAKATGLWRSRSRFKGKLILPVILTGQRQIKTKTMRSKKISVIRTCYENARAQGVWIVEQSLNDQLAYSTFRQVRFPALIAFHEELTGELETGAVAIAGPYWGMNLILWARGLASHPAVGIGGGFLYQIAGGIPRPAKTRVALPPLRRRALRTNLDGWLHEAIERLAPEDRATKELQELSEKLLGLSDEKKAKEQVADFYKRWFDLIDAATPSGRALGLFQDLGSAYVLGKALPTLPSNQERPRQPAAVAEQLMTSCL